VQEIEFHLFAFKLALSNQSGTKKSFNLMKSSYKISSSFSRNLSWIDHLDLVVYNIAHSKLDNKSKIQFIKDDIFELLYASSFKY